MTLPTLTWQAAPVYAFAPAGANATVAELIAAIKAALDAWTASNWMVNDYSAPNGTLEIRRKGAPAGTLGTFRALIFGGSVPNAAALSNNISAGSTTLYLGIAEDAGTTGPSQSYTTGAPYTSTKYAGALSFANNGWVAQASTPRIYLYDNDKMLCIVITTAASWSMVTIGAAVERARDQTEIWCAIGPSTPGGVNASTDAGTSTSAWMQGSNGNGITCGIYHNGTSRRMLYRAERDDSSSQAKDPFIDLANGTSYLVPIQVGECALGGAITASMMGVLRQMRMGPMAVGRSDFRNADSSLRAYSVNGGDATYGRGVYLDQMP